MRLRFALGLPVLVSTLVTFWAVPVGTAFAQAPERAEQPSQPRQIARKSGQPIEAQLTLIDKEVEIVDLSSSPGLGVLDESGSLIVTNAKVYDFIALVKIQKIDSSLTPDRSWVRSQVAMNVLEIWKQSPDKASAKHAKGGTFQLPWEGGRVALDGRTVNARVNWARNLQEGGTYLLFGWHPNGGLRVGPRALYEVIGQRLRSVGNIAGGNRDEIEDTTLDDLRTRIKSVIAAQ